MTDFSFREFLPSDDDVVAGIIGDSEGVSPHEVNLQKRRRENIATMRPENVVHSGASKSAECAKPIDVAISSNGFPESIRVNEKWRDRIRSEDFGSAIQEASRQAMARWAKEHPRPRVRPEEPISPRSLNEIVDDVIQLLDSAIATSKTKSLPTQRQRSDSGNKIVITLTQDGRLSCSADARWVAFQSSTQLNRELSAALASSLQDLQSGSGSSSALANRTSRLSAESLEVIRRAGHL